MKKNQKETFVRINSRVTVAQMKFVKSFAKSKGIGEGEAHRRILEEFMSKKNAK